MEDAKLIHTCLRKAAGVFKSIKVSNYLKKKLDGDVLFKHLSMYYYFKFN